MINWCDLKDINPWQDCLCEFASQLDRNDPRLVGATCVSHYIGTAEQAREFGLNLPSDLNSTTSVVALWEGVCVVWWADGQYNLYSIPTGDGFIRYANAELELIQQAVKHCSELNLLVGQ